MGIELDVLLCIETDSLEEPLDWRETDQLLGDEVILKQGIRIFEFLILILKRGFITNN